MGAPPTERGLSAREIVDLLWPRQASTGDAGKPVRYVAWPSWERATVLVPTRPAGVTAHILRTAGTDATAAGAAKAQLARLVGRSGVLHLHPKALDVTEPEPGTSLVDRIRTELGEDVWAGVHLGPPRANRKPVLNLVGADGRSIGFCKLSINDLTRERLLTESRAIHEAGRRLSGYLQVPRLLQTGSWHGHLYVVTSAVPLSGRVVAPRQEHYDEALRSLVDAWPTREVALADSTWWRQLRQEIRAAQGTEATWLAAKADDVEARASRRPVAFGASHGDWSPWNCAVLSDRLVAWDWERFATDRPLGIDALHFFVQSRSKDHRRHDPRRAVEAMGDRAGELVSRNGADPGSGPLVAVLYLLERGTRFVVDRQEQAGAPKGALATWLRPGLERLLHLVR